MLRSRIFADNKALQACLVSDASHITPGTRGEHVARIQSALVRLRYLSPESALKEVAVYGPKTAAAVFAYKRQFGIVNRRYQTQPDNIVGRMTIASLDHAIWVLDGAGGPPALPGYGEFHPASPRNVTQTAPPLEVSPQAAAAGQENPVRATSTGAFKPPLANLPPEIQAVVQRSNAAKKPWQLMLYPYVAKHEGPLDDEELSKRFAKEADSKTNSNATLQAVFDRMRPFDIWKHIRIIESVYPGSGAKGIFCAPFDHSTLFNHMVGLTRGPVTPLNPYLAQIKVPITDSKFCRDAYNVHGDRISFREIVKQGPGLHICITNAVGRTRTDDHYPYCDCHIDEVQQGQVCVDGMCLPIVNGQTIEHLWTVGPWLLKQPGEWLKKHPLKLPGF